jgi:translation initiation factor 4B
MERGGSRRGGGFSAESDGKSRDFSNWERKGPLSPAPAGPTTLRDGGRVRSRDGPNERKNSPAWGEGRSQDGSRPPRREFQERPAVERQPTAAELDNTWRARMKPDAPAKSSTPTPEPSQPSSPAQSSAPASRPRLQLAKRTVSEAQPADSSATPSSDAKASPFGAARPVDTAAKEKEVEEKRQLAIRQKKEEDEKAREEKKAKEAEAKAAAVEVSKNASEDGDEKNENGSKEGYKILSRADNEKEDGKEAGEAAANGDATTKPKDFVRDPPKGPRNEGGGTWRGSSRGDRGGRGEYRGRGRGDRGDRGGYAGRGERKPSAPSTPMSPKVDSAPEGVEEDGWNTVKPKGPRGRGGARVGAA